MRTSPAHQVLHLGEAMTSQSGVNDGDRRSNLVLRALIDEMLERVRELNRTTGQMAPDERGKAEAELESIMARVRRVASKQ